VQMVLKMRRKWYVEDLEIFQLQSIPDDTHQCTITSIELFSLFVRSCTASDVCFLNASERIIWSVSWSAKCFLSLQHLCFSVHHYFLWRLNLHLIIGSSIQISRKPPPPPPPCIHI
jgi:hypothetical protein